LPADRDTSSQVPDLHGNTIMANEIHPIEKLRRFRGWEWRQRFVESLLSLSPATNPDAADEISDSQFAVASDFPAAEAAERYLQRGLSNGVVPSSPSDARVASADRLNSLKVSSHAAI
jgi:hypothetical protein